MQPARGLDPRGARTRAGCPCQAPALRGKLRCRLHGGRSTGPRTPAGLAKIRAARTIHGNYGAKERAVNRYRITLLCRTRVTVAAKRTQAFLPPVFVARLHGYPPELVAPSFPTGGSTAAQDQMRRRAVAAALAPWRRAIAEAREAAREAARTARKQAAATRAAEPNARARPRRPRPRRPTPQALLAALLAELLAPERAPAVPDAGATEPYGPFSPTGPAAPATTPAGHPHPAAHTNPAQRTHTHTQTPSQNSLHQRPHPARAKPPRQNPLHQQFRPHRARHRPDRTLWTISADRPRRPGDHAGRGPAPGRPHQPGPTRTHKPPAKTLCTRGRTRPAPDRRARTL